MPADGWRCSEIRDGSQKLPPFLNGNALDKLLNRMAFAKTAANAGNTDTNMGGKFRPKRAVNEVPEDAEKLALLQADYTANKAGYDEKVRGYLLSADYAVLDAAMADRELVVDSTTASRLAKALGLVKTALVAQEADNRMRAAAAFACECRVLPKKDFKPLPKNDFVWMERTAW